MEHFTYLGIYLVLLAAGLGVPIPEESMVITGAILSYKGITHWYYTLLVLYAGIFTGDLFIYWLGYRFGDRLLGRPFFKKHMGGKRLERVRAFYAKHGDKSVFFTRHVMGLRAASFFTSGTMQVPLHRFLFYDFLACLISIPTVFYLFYHFGNEVETAYYYVKCINIGIWAGIASVILVAIVLWKIGHRKIPIPPRS